MATWGWKLIFAALMATYTMLLIAAAGAQLSKQQQTRPIVEVQRNTPGDDGNDQWAGNCTGWTASFTNCRDTPD